MRDQGAAGVSLIYAVMNAFTVLMKLPVRSLALAYWKTQMLKIKLPESLICMQTKQSICDQHRAQLQTFNKPRFSLQEYPISPQVTLQSNWNLKEIREKEKAPGYFSSTRVQHVKLILGDVR